MEHLVDIESLSSFARQVLEAKGNSVARELAKGFNVFKAMRRCDEEVRLHSRFLSSIIDPTAPHGLGFLPLERLLALIFPDKEFGDLKNVRIEPNYRDKAEHNNIDILIVSDSWAVVIENKIWAGDSNHPDDETENGGQLCRYVNFVRDECGMAKDSVFPVYLTVDGHEPSERSRGKLDVRTVSYSRDIIQWLKGLLPLCSADTRLFINQYVEVINSLIMPSDAELNKELKDIIGQEGNEELRGGLTLLFQKEKDILWHITSDLLWAIIDLLKKTKHPVKDIAVSRSSFDSDFKNAIADGLTKLFHRGSNGAYIALKIDSGEAAEQFYFGINNRKHQGMYFIVRDKRFNMSHKESFEDLGYTVVTNKTNHHFEHAEKYIDINGKRLNLLSLGSEETMNLTNKNHLETVAGEISQIIKGEIRRLRRIK